MKFTFATGRQIVIVGALARTMVAAASAHASITNIRSADSWTRIMEVDSIVVSGVALARMNLIAICGQPAQPQ